MAKKTTTEDIIKKNEYRETDEKGKPIVPVDPDISALKQQKPYREMSLDERMADNAAKMNFLDKYLSGPRSTQTGYATVQDVFNTGYSELYFQKNHKFDPNNLPDDIAQKNYEIVGKDNSKKMWSTFGKRVVDGIVKSSLVPIRGPWNARPEFDYENDPFYIITHGSSSLVENPENVGKKFTKEYFMNQFASLGTSVGMAADMAIEGAIIGGVLKLAKAGDIVKAAKLKRIEKISNKEQAILAKKYAKTGEKPSSLGLEEIQRRMAIEDGAEYAGDLVGHAARYVNHNWEVAGNAVKSGLISFKNATINFQFNINESFTRIKSENPDIDDATAAKIAYDEAIDKYGWEMAASCLVNYSQQARLTRIANTKMTNLNNEINMAAASMRIGLKDRAMEPVRRTAASNVAEFIGNMFEEGAEEIMEDSFAAWGRKSQYERNKEMYDKLGIGLSQSDMYDFDKAFDSFFGGFLGGGILGGTQMGLKYAFGGKQRKYLKEQEKQRDAIKQGFSDVIRIRGQQFLSTARALNELENAYRNGADISDGRGGVVSKDNDQYDEIYQQRKEQINRAFDEKANALNAISMAETAIKLSLTGDENELKGYITDNKESQLIFLDALNMFESMEGNDKKAAAVEAVFKLSELQDKINQKKAQGEDYSVEQEQYAEILANSLNNIGEDMLSSINAMKDAGILKQTANGYEYDSELAEKAKKDVKDSIAITDIFNNAFYVAYSQANEDIGAALEYAKSQVNRLYSSKMAGKEIDNLLSRMKPVINQLKTAGINNPYWLNLFDTSYDEEHEKSNFTEDQRIKKRQIAVLQAFFESINHDGNFDHIIRVLSDFRQLDGYGDITGTTQAEINEKFNKKRNISDEYYAYVYENAKNNFSNDEKLKEATKRIGSQMNKRMCAAVVYNVLSSEQYKKVRETMTNAQYYHMFDLFKEGKYDELTKFVNKLENGTEDEFNYGETIKENAEYIENRIRSLSEEIDQLVNEEQGAKEHNINVFTHQIDQLSTSIRDIDVIQLMQSLENVRNELENENQKSDPDSSKIAELLLKEGQLKDELTRYNDVQKEISVYEEVVKYLKGEISKDDIEGWRNEYDSIVSENSKISERSNEKTNEINGLEQLLEKIRTFNVEAMDLFGTSILQMMNKLIPYDKMDTNTVRATLKENVSDSSKVAVLVEEFKAIQRMRNKTKRDNAKHDFQLKMLLIVTQEKKAKLEEERRKIDEEHKPLEEKMQKMEDEHPLFFAVEYNQLRTDVESSIGKTSREEEINAKKAKLKREYQYDYDTKLYDDQQVLDDESVTPHYSSYSAADTNREFNDELKRWLEMEESKDLAVDYGPLSEMSNAGHFFAIGQGSEKSDESTAAMLYEASTMALKVGGALASIKRQKEFADYLTTAAGQMAYYHKTLLRDIMAMPVNTVEDGKKKLKRLNELRGAINRYCNNYLYRGIWAKSNIKGYDKVFGDVDMQIDYQINMTNEQIEVIEKRMADRAKKKKESDMSAHSDAKRNMEILQKNLSAEELASMASDDLSKIDEVIAKINKMADDKKITEDKAKTIIRELKRSKAIGRFTSFFNKFKKNDGNQQQGQPQQPQQSQQTEQQQTAAQTTSSLEENVVYRTQRFIDLVESNNETAVKLNNSIAQIISKRDGRFENVDEDFFKNNGIPGYDFVVREGTQIYVVKIENGQIKKGVEVLPWDSTVQQPQPENTMANDEITLTMFANEPVEPTPASIFDIFANMQIKNPNRSNNALYDIMDKIRALLNGPAINSLSLKEFVPSVMEQTGKNEAEALAWLENVRGEISNYNTATKDNGDIYDYYSDIKKTSDWTDAKIVLRAAIVSAFGEEEISVEKFKDNLQAKAKEKGYEIVFNQSQAFYSVKAALGETNERLAKIEQAIAEGGGIGRPQAANIKELERQDGTNRKLSNQPINEADNQFLPDSVMPVVHNGSSKNGVIESRYTVDGKSIVDEEGVKLLSEIGEGTELYFDDNLDKIVAYNMEIDQFKKGGKDSVSKILADFKEKGDNENLIETIVAQGIIKVYAKTTEDGKEKYVCIGYIDSIKGFYDLIQNTKAKFTEVDTDSGKRYFFDDKQVADRIERREKRSRNVRMMKEAVCKGALKSIKAKTVRNSRHKAALQEIDKEQREKQVIYAGPNNKNSYSGDNVLKQSERGANTIIYGTSNPIDPNDVEVPQIKGVQMYSPKYDGIVPRSNDTVFEEGLFNLEESNPEVFTHVKEGLKKQFLLYLLHGIRQEEVGENRETLINFAVDFLWKKHQECLPAREDGWTEELVREFVSKDGPKNEYAEQFTATSWRFFIRTGKGKYPEGTHMVYLPEKSSQCAVFMFSANESQKNYFSRKWEPSENGYYIGFAQHHPIDGEHFSDAYADNKLDVSGCLFKLHQKGNDISLFERDVERMYDRCVSERAMNALRTCDIDVTQDLNSITIGQAKQNLNGKLIIGDGGEMKFQSSNMTLERSIANGISLHTGGMQYKIDDSTTVEVQAQTTIDLDYDNTAVAPQTTNALYGIPDAASSVKEATKEVKDNPFAALPQEESSLTPPITQGESNPSPLGVENPMLNAEVFINDYDLTEIEMTDLSRSIVRSVIRRYFENNGRFGGDAMSIITRAIKRVFQENAEKIDQEAWKGLTGRQLLILRYIWEAINWGGIKSYDNHEDIVKYILSKYEGIVKEEQILDMLNRIDEDNVKEAISVGGVNDKGKDIVQKRIKLSDKRTLDALFGKDKNVFGGYMNSELERIFGQEAGTLTPEEIVKAQEMDKPVFEWNKEGFDSALLDTLPNEVKVFFSIIPRIKKVDGKFEETGGKEGSITELLRLTDYYSTQEVLDMLRMLSVKVDGNFFDFIDALDNMSNAGGKYANMARSVSNAIKSVKDKALLQKIAYFVTNKEACNFVYMHRSKMKDGRPFISERYALTDTVAYDVMRTIEKNLLLSIDDKTKYITTDHGKQYTEWYANQIDSKIKEVVRGNNIIDDFEKVADVLEYIYGYRFSENTLEQNRRDVNRLLTSIRELFIGTDKNERLMFIDISNFNETEVFDQGDDEEATEVKTHPRIVKYGNGKVGDHLRELVKKDLKNNPESLTASLITAGKTIQSTTHRTFAEKQKNEILDASSALRKYCIANGYDHMYFQMKEEELDGDERKLSRGLISISAFSNESKVSEDITTLTYGDNLNLEMMFALSCRDDYSGISKTDPVAALYPQETIVVERMRDLLEQEAGNSTPWFEPYTFRTRYSTTLDFVDSDKKKAGWWKLKSLVVEQSSTAGLFDMSDYIDYLTRILFDNEFKRIYKIIGSDIKRPGEELFLTCTHFNEIEIDFKGYHTLGELIRDLNADNKLQILLEMYRDKNVREKIRLQSTDICRQLFNRNLKHLVNLEVDQNGKLNLKEEKINKEGLLNIMQDGALYASGYWGFDENGNFKSDFHNKHYVDRMRPATSDSQIINPIDIVWGALDYSINSLINRSFIIDVMYGGRYTYGKEELFASPDLQSADKMTRMRAYHAISATINNNLYKRMAGILTGGNMPDFSLVYRNADGSFKKEFLDKDGGNPWGGENSDEFMYLIVHNDPIVSPLIKQYLSYFYDMDEAEQKETFELCDKIHDNKTPEKERKEIIKKLSIKYPLVKGYLKIDATDGQEFCTWREALDLMVASGKLNDEESEKRIRRLYRDLAAGKANKEDTEWLMRTLNVVKPVYFGKNISEGNLRQDISYIKSSVMPLLPQCTFGTEWDNVRKHLEAFEERHRRNVHLVFDSASKVINSVSSSDVINYKSLKSAKVSMGKLDASSFVAYRKYYSVQNETDPKMDKKLQHNEEKSKRIYIGLENQLKKIKKAIDDEIIDADFFFNSLVKAGVRIDHNGSEYFLDSLMHTAAYTVDKKNSKVEYDKLRKAVSLKGDGEFIDKVNFIANYAKYLEDNGIEIDYDFVRKAVADMRYYETRALAVKLLKNENSATDKKNIDAKIAELKKLSDKELYNKFRENGIRYLTIRQSDKFVDEMFGQQIEEYKTASKMVSEMMNNLADINTESDEYTQLDHIATSGGVNLMDEKIFAIDRRILSEEGMTNVLDISGRPVSKDGMVMVSGRELDDIRTRYAFIHRNRRMAQFYLDIGLIDDVTYKKLANGESVISLNNVNTSNPVFLQRVRRNIYKQLKERGVSENVLKYIGFDGKKFTMPMFFNENMERIELLLQAEIKRNVSKTRLNGAGLYVGTSDGFKKTGSFKVMGEDELGDLSTFVDEHGDTVIWLERDRRNVGKRLQASILAGKKLLMAECAISPQYTYFDRNEKKEKVIDFYSTDKDGNYIYLCDAKGKKINKKTKLSDVPDGVFIDKNMVDPNIFKIMSLRVPTSGHMSASALKIVAFLPKSYSSTIIVPSDHVTQFGEDFDIDKRYCYMPNYYIDDDGKIIKVTRDLIEQKRDEFGFDKSAVYSGIRKSLPNMFESLEDQLQSNYMTDLYISIFTCASKKVQKLIASVIGYDELTTTKETVIKMMESDEDALTPTTLGLIHDQVDMRVKAYVGKVGIAAYSNNVVFGGALQKIGDGILMKKNGKVCKIRVGKYEFNGNLSEPECNKRTDGTNETRATKQVVNSRRQNSAVDNIKADNIPYLNENSVTLPFIIGMNNFGFDQSEPVNTNIRYNEQTGEYEEYGDENMQRLDIASLVCVQPIVRHFTRLELDLTSRFKKRQTHLQNVIDTLKAFGLTDEEIETIRNNKSFKNGKFYLTEDGILMTEDAKVFDSTSREQTFVWNYDELTGDYMMKQIRFGSNHYGKDNIEGQLLALSLFTRVKKESQELGSFRSLINVNSQGIGKYYLATYEKINQLNKIGRESEGGTYKGIAKIIGSFIKKDGRPPMPGFIDIKGCDYYIMPTTVEGLTLINTIKANEDILGGVFGFSNPVISDLIDDFYDMIKDMSLTQERKEYLFRKYRRDFAQYCFLLADEIAKRKRPDDGGIFKENKTQNIESSIEAERLRLVAKYYDFLKRDGDSRINGMDRPIFHSIIKIMQMSLVGAETNAVVKQLGVRSDGMLQFKLKGNQQIDVNQFHNELLSMWQKPVNIIPGYNYTSRDFVADFISYAYITDDLNGMMSIKGIIPEEIMEYLGFTGALRDIWDNLEDAVDIENFKMQFIINNIDDFDIGQANENFRGGQHILTDKDGKLWFKGKENELIDTMKECGILSDDAKIGEYKVPVVFKHGKEMYVLDMESTRWANEGAAKINLPEKFYAYRKAKPRSSGMNLYDPYVDYTGTESSARLNLQSSTTVGIVNDNTRETIKYIESIVPGDPMTQLFRHVVENDRYTPISVSLKLGGESKVVFHSLDRCDLHLPDQANWGTLKSVAASSYIGGDKQQASKRIIADEEMMHIILSRYISTISKDGKLDRNAAEMKYSFRAFDKLKAYYESIRNTDEIDSVYKSQLDNIFGFGTHSTSSEALQFNEFLSNIISNNISLIELIDKYEATSEFNSDSELNKEGGILENIWKVLRAIFDALISKSKISRNVAAEVLNTLNDIYNINAIENSKRQALPAAATRVLMNFKKENVKEQANRINSDITQVSEFTKHLPKDEREDYKNDLSDDKLKAFDDYLSRLEGAVTVTSQSKINGKEEKGFGATESDPLIIGNIYDAILKLFFSDKSQNGEGELERRTRLLLDAKNVVDNDKINKKIPKFKLDDDQIADIYDKVYVPIREKFSKNMRFIHSDETLFVSEGYYIDTDGKRVHVQGKPDCIIIDGNHIAIIDYKTFNTSKEQTLLEIGNDTYDRLTNYAMQIQFYKHLVSDATGVPVQAIDGAILQLGYTKNGDVVKNGQMGLIDTKEIVKDRIIDEYDDIKDARRIMRRKGEQLQSPSKYEFEKLFCPII